MDWWLIAFLLGAIASLFLPIIPDVFYLIITVIVTFTVSVSAFRFHLLKPLSGFCFGVLAIMASAVHYNTTFLVDSFVTHKSDNTLFDKPVVVIGRVINIAKRSSDALPVKALNEISIADQRFNFLVSSVNGEKLAQSFVIRLKWNAHIQSTDAQKNNQEKTAGGYVKQGQQWQFLVKLKPSHGLANIGGFNYQRWLRTKDIVATGYVKNTKNSNASNANNTPRLLINEVSIRQQLYSKIEKLLVTKVNALFLSANLPLEHSSRESSNGNNFSALLLALSFGERGSIDEETWQVLKHTGTQHLIAISGLHIGLVATASYLFFSWLLRFSAKFLTVFPRLQLPLMLCNYRVWAVFASCVLCGFYAYLAGFALPTLRALLMLYLFWGFRLMGLAIPAYRLLLITVAIIIVLWPMSLTSMSFWLSFSAVVIILLSYWCCGHWFDENKSATWKTQRVNSAEKENSEPCEKSLPDVRTQPKIKSWLLSLVFLQAVLSVAMLPFVGFNTFELPLLSFFANIIAVPFMSFSTIPLCLLGVLASFFSDNVAAYLFYLAYLSIDFLWHWLSYISAFKLSAVAVSHHQMSIVLVSIILTSLVFKVFLYLTNKLQHKLDVKGVIPLVFITTFIFMIFFFPSSFPEKNDDETIETSDKKAKEVLHEPARENLNESMWLVDVLDVGQGLAVVIQKNGHAILYDTGASYPSGFNMAEAVIIPYMQYHGIHTFDYVIISHSDNDHAGGLAILRRQNKVKSVIANDANLQGDEVCLSQNTLIWQGLALTILSPDSVKGKENDDSCVIKISDGTNSLLLTGDISKKIEKKLIKSPAHVNLLNADILIAPHHGSKTSSSREFIKAVAPEFVVFSAGYKNRWQMPTTEIVNRYQTALHVNQPLTPKRSTLEVLETNILDLKIFEPQSLEPSRQLFTTAGDGMIRFEMTPAQTNQAKSAAAQSAKVKSAQVKSAQVKSAQVKSAQVKSAQVKSAQHKNKPSITAKPYRSQLLPFWFAN